jgi:cellulose synthase/poly-beta-1,6-N-acetylglucosamine synthase-like glycosyltransferase
MSSLVSALQWFFLLYFAAESLAGTALNLLSIGALRRRIAMRPFEELPPASFGFEPPVSLLVVACDEEATIAATVRALLELDYPELEIVVVDDGSKDATLEALRSAFELEPFPEAQWRGIRTKPVRTFYRSRSHPNVRVVDKERGGRADALNAAIDAARFPLVCAIDARWTLQRGGLRRTVEPFVDDPATVASGATLHIASGGLPRDPLALLQVAAWMRGTLFGRVGWSRLDAALDPGTFRVFRKDALVEAGGYRTGVTGEDMELVMRLHRILRARRERYAIRSLPEVAGSAEAPATLAAAESLHKLAQRGLAENLHRNAAMAGHGPAGILAWPYSAVFGCCGPAIEAAAYVFMLAMWLSGQVSGAAFAAFLAFVVSLGFLHSASALLLEGISQPSAPRFSRQAVLAAAALAENLGYRQLVGAWRLMAMARWLRDERRTRAYARVALKS